MSTFGLATLNIHSFRNPSNYDSNISDLISILEPLNLDLIAVQEIQSVEKWKLFCQRLSLPNFISGQCYLEPFHNGIASRYLIKSYTNLQANSPCVGGTRALLQCRLGSDHPFTKDRVFGVTDLDHLNENDRLKQINEFNLHTQNIDILMGDMNALTREDYSNQYYQNAVFEVRDGKNFILI